MCAHTHKRTALVAWRNRAATSLRLFVAPFLFLLLALLIDKALQANDRTSNTYADVTDPTTTYVGAIPSCHSDMYIGIRNCTEILYSPNNAITQVPGYVKLRCQLPIVLAAVQRQSHRLMHASHCSHARHSHACATLVRPFMQPRIPVQVCTICHSHSPYIVSPPPPSCRPSWVMLRRGMASRLS